MLFNRESFLRRTIFIGGSLVWLSMALAANGWARHADPAEPVRADIAFGRANAALLKLNAALAQNPSDAEAHNLRCRVFYQEEQWDHAIADCEAAVKASPADSNFHLWLGRAYGQKAERVSLISAFKLARKLAAEFQQAVQLDSRNADALADLGEFDVEAPSIVGGGVNRAIALVPQLQAVNPIAALSLQARIAESKKDYPTAESQLKAAIAQSPDSPGPWMDLASFYRRRGRPDDMLTAVHTGASLDHLHGSALVDGASILTREHLEPQTAIQWLQQYLNSQAQTEDAPSFAVRSKLADLLSQQGDMAGAEQQIALVRALASGYHISVRGASAAEGE
jgi:tetratricopeptide (TPR) repeat protein